MSNASKLMANSRLAVFTLIAAEYQTSNYIGLGYIFLMFLLVL